MDWQFIECPATQPNIVLRGWRLPNKGKPVLFFLHGNGFCGRLYEPLLQHFADDFELFALDVCGHGASDDFEPFVGWNRMADLCIDVIDQSADWIADRKIVAGGHSLGAILHLLIAAQRPRLFEGLVLLDPILFPRRMLAMFWFTRLIGVYDRLHPLVRSTRKRRNEWATREEAKSYFRKRGIYRHWHQQALDNYAEFGLRDTTEGQVVLCCSPTLEANIFATWPKKLWQSIRSIQSPVVIYTGDKTFPFARNAAEYAAKVNSNIQHRSIAGQHCFMLDSPDETAATITAAINQLV